MTLSVGFVGPNNRHGVNQDAEKDNLFKIYAM